MNAKNAVPRTRNAEDTQKRILKAAKREFARCGLAGARVDVIAERGKINKRMIYHYFGSKRELFQRVLEEAYTDIRVAEQKLQLDQLPAREALEKLVRFTIKVVSRRFVEMVDDLLKRGVEEGVFRPGVDPVQCSGAVLTRYNLISRLQVLPITI